MKKIILLAALLSVLLPKFTDGLQCYDCSVCTEPFSTSSATFVTTNTPGASCYKTVVGSVVSRGSSSSCVQTNTVGNGMWCCSTDLCNASPNLMKLSIAVIVSALLMIIIA